MKKGFTLIELLAVIVVLAIIALIAVPIVINIINDSKKESDKRSIELYAKLFEKVIAIDNDNGKYKLLNYYKDKVEENYKGNRVQCDFHPDRNDDEHYSTLINGKLILRGCVVGDNEDYIYNYDNGNIKKAKAYQEYIVGDMIKISNEQYYVIRDSSKKENYVTALKKYPLTVDEVNLYGGVGTENNYVNKYTKTSQGTAYNHNGYGGMAYYTSETCQEHQYGVSYGGCKTNYNDSDVKHVVDNWANTKFQNNELKEVNNYMARLIEKEEIRSIGWSKCSVEASICNYDIQDIQYSEWTGGIGSSGSYWTMTKYNDSSYFMWVVYSWIGSNTVYNYTGNVRPVINVYKDKIQKE